MKISDTIGSTTRLSNFNNLGCPVYILDARLQNVCGGSSPKLDHQDPLGIYLNQSPYHSGIVELVMNTKSGLISPQFHLVFDEIFETVPHLWAGTVPENWSE